MGATVSVSSDAVLTDGMRQYVDVLAAALPAGFPLTVTSGYRSPSAQAAAMLVKYKAGGVNELYKTYSDDSLISKLVKYPTDQWANFIASNGQSLSRHLRAGAIDLRTRDLSSSQVEQLKSAVVATGGKHLQESTPPHLHVDMPLKYAATSLVNVATSVATTTAKSAATMWLWSAAIGSSVLLVAYLVSKRKAAPAPEAP